MNGLKPSNFRSVGTLAALSGVLPSRPDSAKSSETSAQNPLLLSVSQSIQSFDDVEGIINHLRAGFVQIVSFDSTPAALMRRFVDMLSGATWSLGGVTTPVGERVYLFTPPLVSLVTSGHAAAPST